MIYLVEKCAATIGLLIKSAFSEESSLLSLLRKSNTEWESNTIKRGWGTAITPCFSQLWPEKAGKASECFLSFTLTPRLERALNLPPNAAFFLFNPSSEEQIMTCSLQFLSSWDIKE